MSKNRSRKRLLAALAALALLAVYILLPESPAGAPGTAGSAPSAAASVSQAAALPDSEPDRQAVSLPDSEPDSTAAGEPDTPAESAAPTLDEAGSYTTRDDVALYIHLYGHLPDNFITKKEAGALGWTGGSLEPYAPGKCIGGDRFGNYEGLLPEDRTYTECDIDTLGAASRGAKRLVFSPDGLIYYTADHYETFELLYGEE